MKSIKNCYCDLTYYLNVKAKDQRAGYLLSAGPTRSSRETSEQCSFDLTEYKKNDKLKIDVRASLKSK